MKQLEFDFEELPVRTVDDLHGLALSSERMRASIRDLLFLAESLYNRSVHGNITGISDIRSVKFISELLVGRVGQMLESQHQRYRKMIGVLVQFVPPPKKKMTF
jgi:hypothetical protein